MAWTRFCGRPSWTRHTRRLYSSPPGAAPPRATKGRLAKNVLNDLATYLRQALFPAQMHVAQGILIETHLIQQGSVQIAEVDGLLDGFEPDRIRSAVDCAALETTAGH